MFLKYKIKNKKQITIIATNNFSKRNRQYKIQIKKET